MKGRFQSCASNAPGTTRVKHRQ
uniref:Uncharacterized protein n=1 Tax=Arundo donax TaxID=35708 RepID=A0A0A9A102_ARUDO